MISNRRHFLAGTGSAYLLGACADDAQAPNEPGAHAPSFLLADFQPKSDRFGESYGLDEFRGSVLLLPLYAGWCDTCIGCADILDDVYKEWQAEGLNVRVAAINPINAKPHQKFLAEVCAFPLLQDTEEAQAWQALAGTKDDTYVYDSGSVLRRFVNYTADLNAMIVTEAGQALFRQAIIDAGG